jgi:hypothetical protein
MLIVLSRLAVGHPLAARSNGNGGRMARLILRQSPDGVWYAEDPAGGTARADNIGGWEQLMHLLMSRFRAQFGEPPVNSDVVSRMEIA